MKEQNKLVVFQEKDIRRIWHQEEWWFAVLDIIEVLTDTTDPSQYFKRMRQRDEALKSYVGTNCTHVALEGKTGKKRKTTIGNTEHVFRIIQSITSPKAEPFKQWLAKVAYERIQEIENPELAAERARQYYKELGYSDDWIAKRLQSIEVRGKLTDEWKERGVKEGIEYSILTAEISSATFGMKPSEYKEFKDLKRENLRDHMTDLELIFTMLGETATKNEAQNTDAKGFNENKKAAIKGGSAAGKALNTFEQEMGQEVVSDKNYKGQIAEAKKQKKIATENKKHPNI
ncbi:MAG: DNA-damage-inducible protein D [Paraglaciecola sp.]|jgi:DNA-damage-inducible protein D